MKINISFPEEKISWFRDKLGITNKDFKQLDKVSHLFIKNKSGFSAYFFDYFSRIDETDFFLTHQDHSGNIGNIWEEWFASFFRNNLDHGFLMSLWRSGLRHVEINIDHRFITLSYSILRQFCQDIVKNEVSPDEQKSILITIDKMVDFCLLIETHAFIEATSRCDMEVVRGISHQVRNPLTVIGGYAMRLMNNTHNDTSHKDISEICKTIINESKRLEKMVSDAASYSDMYEKETDYSGIFVNSLISDAIDISEVKKESPEITIKISPDDLMIQGDREDLEMLFANIFKHCAETSGQTHTDISLSAIYNDVTSPFVEIEILNKGFFQKPEEIQNAFVPFYSSKPDGTGFSLSIARLAARKSLGDVHIENLPDEGLRYIIKLPVLIKK